MIRKKKSYSRPMKPFEKSRIEEENVLLKKYALKNKKEVWKTLAKINYYRKRAMSLAQYPQEEQKLFLNKLKNLGLNINSITDVLGLKVEDLLKRRLPTIVANNGLANTIKQARQMVVHKKILVNDSVVNSPSYIVPVTEENIISIKEKKKARNQEEQAIKTEEKK